MTASRVHIDELQIRIEGLLPEDADILGREVVKRLGDHLPGDLQTKSLKRLEITVTIPLDTPRERLAHRIAGQICKGLV